MTSFAHVHGVAVCPDCTAELEVRCPNGHDPLPIAVTKSRDDELAQLTDERLELITKLERFEAAAHDRRKGSATSAAETRETAVGARYQYARKTCGCGEEFTPTGPNSKRCPRCRRLAS